MVQMASRSVASAFRKRFSYPSLELTQYFPGHMARGLNNMQRILREVDCIIEVHDARIPLSGRNIKFDTTVRIRPHLLVLNKSDLAMADRQQKRAIAAELERSHDIKHVLYTSCKDTKSKVVRREILPKVLEMVQAGDRFHRADAEDFNILVIGVPNVGKSSIINTLRSTYMKKGRATPVGALAGVTRSIMTRIKIHENPHVYIFDSPGILQPNVENIEVGLKLAACATLQDHLVGVEHIVDYLLFWLNKHNEFQYVKFFDLKEPIDNVLYVLLHIAKTRDYRIKGLNRETNQHIIRPNINRAALVFLAAFRTGELGIINLDIDQINGIRNKPDKYPDNEHRRRTSPYIRT